MKREVSFLRWGVADVLAFAVGAGCLFGLGEVAAIAWRYFIAQDLTRTTPHVAWMAPLGYASYFMIVSLPAILIGQTRRRTSHFLIPIVMLGVFGWVAMLPWDLYPAALGILSLGIAVGVGRILRVHEEPLRRAARIAAPVLAAIVGLIAALIFMRVGLRERQALAALPTAPSGSPNVLLLILDTVRAKSLGLHGRGLETSPNLDALAAESIVFERAQATAPWTLPSHASMFTGRWPHETSANWDLPLDSRHPTLAEVLGARGYATAGFVANLLYTSRPLGLDRGFVRYEDFPVSPGQMVLSTSLGREVATHDGLRALLGWHELLNRKPAERVNHDFLEWLENRARSRPFFAFLNYFDAHEPYEPPEAFRRRFVDADYRRDGIVHSHSLLRGVDARRLDAWSMSPAEAENELGLYEASIAALDARLGELFARLASLDLMDNTLIVVTSDHGEQMGEHGLFGHLQSLYQPVTHVPLVVRLPGGARGGTRIEAAVSLRDLPSTLLDLIGLPSGLLPGQSLANLWEPDREPRVSWAVSQLRRGLAEQPWYPIAAGFQMQALLNGTFFYICNPDATEELYDLASDPGETENLAGTPFGDQAILAFRRAIAHVDAPPRWCPPPPDNTPRRPDRQR